MQSFFNLPVPFMAHLCWRAKTLTLHDSIQVVAVSKFAPYLSDHGHHSEIYSRSGTLRSILGKPPGKAGFITPHAQDEFRMKKKDTTHQSLWKLTGDLIGSRVTRTLSDMREVTGREGLHGECPLLHRPLHSDQLDLGSGY